MDAAMETRGWPRRQYCHGRSIFSGCRRGEEGMRGAGRRAEAVSSRGGTKHAPDKKPRHGSCRAPTARVQDRCTMCSGSLVSSDPRGREIADFHRSCSNRCYLQEGNDREEETVRRLYLNLRMSRRDRINKSVSLSLSFSLGGLKLKG